MPSTTRYQNFIQVIFNPYQVSYPRSGIVYYADSQKSSSPRRAKPLDLFASSTSVSAHRIEEIYGSGSAQIKEYDPSTGSYSRVSGYYEYPSYGASGVPSADTANLTQQGIDAASVATRGKVKDQKVNLALSLAAGRKPVSMVNELASESLYFYMKLRRQGLPSIQYFKKNWKRLPKQHKELSDKWLAYQYGMKPVVSDLYGAAEEFSRRASGIKYTYGRVNDTKSRTYTVADPYTNTSCTHAVTVNTTIRYRFAETYNGPSTAMRLGLTNIPDLLWNLYPYSFVFDAIYDVGSYLHGMDALVGVSGFLQSTTSRVEAYSARTSTDSTNRNGTRHLKSISRSAAVPFVPYGQPQWNNKAPSITRLANYVSLLSQIRG